MGFEGFGVDGSGVEGSRVESRWFGGRSSRVNGLKVQGQLFRRFEVQWFSGSGIEGPSI